MRTGTPQIFINITPAYKYYQSYNTIYLKENRKKMEDKTLVCQDCGSEFIFTVGEQEFYKEKGFDNEPKRCKECRDKKKQQRRQFREERLAAERAAAQETEETFIED